MGAFILFMLFVWGFYVAIEKAAESADRAADRRRQSEPLQPPQTATPSSRRHGTSHVDRGLAGYQRQHDGACRAKIRRAEAHGNPRSYYVYEHVDQTGRVRYVGHGRAARAWSRVRTSHAHRDLLDRGELEVRVVEHGLTAREAVSQEAGRIDRRTEDGSPLFNRLRGTRI